MAFQLLCAAIVSGDFFSLYLFAFFFSSSVAAMPLIHRVRYRKQKKQQKSPRYPKSLASPFDAPVAVRAANGVGESGALVDDAVLYDELLS